MPEGDIVLTAGPLLGLGDHSVWTTLPERFANLGHDVYLDKDNRASNPEIFDLLWKRNPYIKGLSDRKPNAGYVRQGLFYVIANELPGYRSIEAVERAHGLPPPYSMAPRIYYEPKPFIMTDLSDAVLLDFSAVSSKIGLRGIQDAIDYSVNARFGKVHGFVSGAKFLTIVHRKFSINNEAPILGSKYQVQSIFEYVDMIAACRAWCGSEAGGQALASAVRGDHDVYEIGVRPEVVVTITPATFNSRGYTFRNVDYRVTGSGDNAIDYFRPVEVENLKYEVTCRHRQADFEERWRNAHHG